MRSMWRRLNSSRSRRQYSEFPIWRCLIFQSVIFTRFILVTVDMGNCHCITHAVPASGMGSGGAKCRLAPTVKQTGQESGGELSEIFKFWSFLQSKSVNNVYKVLQLSGDFVPRSPTRASPPDPIGDFRPADPLGYKAPKWKFLAPLDSRPCCPVQLIHLFVMYNLIWTK